VKLVIVGRRAPGITRSEMKRYMLDVHGPLVVADPGLTASSFARYRQNHVVDGLYGSAATIGRDMVAEMEFVPGADPRAIEAHPHMTDAVHPDEVNFAHLTDRVFTPVREDVVVRPPTPAGRTGAARHLKVIHVLQAPDGAVGDAFHERWAAADGPALEAADPLGYVRNVTLPGPGGPAQYGGIAELWFPLGDEGTAALGRWAAAIAAAGLVDVDRSYALIVTEHQIHPGPQVDPEVDENR
jgi:hypothetical protein